MGLPADGFTYLGSLEIPSLGGATASNVPTVIKNADFTAAMLASLKADGGDLRLSSDLVGDTQLPIEIVDNLNVLWTLVPSVAATIKIYVWGNKPASVKEIDTAPFGSEAVWVDYEAVIHANESGTNGVFYDSTGNGHSTTKRTGGTLSAVSGNPIGGTWPNFTQNQTLSITNSSALINNTPFTLSAWVDADVVNISVGLLSSRYIGDTDSGTVRVDGNMLTQATGAFNIASGTTTSVGVKTLLKAKQNTTSLQAVTNGTTTGTETTLDGAESINNLDAANTFMISGYYDEVVGRRLDGQAAEFRIKRSKDTDDFDSIEYDNQSATDAWWIAEDAGGEGVTGSSSFAITKPTFASAGSATLPQPSGSISFNLGNPLFASIGIATLPQPSGAVSFTIDKPVFASSGSATLPQPSGLISFSLAKPIFTATGSSTTTANTGAVIFDIAKPVFSADGSATLPQPSGIVGVTIGKPAFTATGSATIPEWSATGNITINKPIFTATGSTTLPAPAGSVNFAIDKPIFSGYATVSGIVIVNGTNSTITLETKSNFIGL